MKHSQSLLVALVVAFFAIGGSLSCVEPYKPTTDFSALRVTMNNIAVAWRAGESLRVLGQHALAKERYEEALTYCGEFQEIRQGNDIVAKMITDIQAILQLEPYQKAGNREIQINGQWRPIADGADGEKGALSLLLTELKEKVDPQVDREMDLHSSLIRSNSRSRSDQTQQAINSLLGYDQLALAYLVPFAQDRRDHHLRAMTASLLMRTKPGSSPESPREFMISDYKGLIGLVLSEMLSDRQSVVVAAAADAIGARGYEQALPQLMAAIENPPQKGLQQPALKACLNAIAAFDQVYEQPGGGMLNFDTKRISLAELILPEYLDPEGQNIEVRRLAVAAVSKIQNHQVRQKLTHAVVAVFAQGGDPILRANAARVLSEIGSPEAVSALSRDPLAGDDAMVKMVLHALANTGHYDAILPIRQALRFGDEAIRDYAMEMLEHHARINPTGNTAALELGMIVNTYPVAMRVKALDRLVNAGTIMTLRQLIDLAQVSSPVIAIQAAHRLSTIRPEVLFSELDSDQRARIQSGMFMAKKRQRYQVALLLAKTINADTKAVGLDPYDLSRSTLDLEAAPATVCWVKTGEAEESVISAYGESPLVREHYIATAVGAFKAMVYPYEGIAFHLKANSIAKPQSKGFSVYEIELLPNYAERYLGMQIGDPVHNVINLFGAPKSVEASDDGLDVLTYKVGHKRVRIYCDDTVRRIIFRDPQILGSEFNALPTFPTPPPQLVFE